MLSNYLYFFHFQIVDHEYAKLHLKGSDCCSSSDESGMEENVPLSKEKLPQLPTSPQVPLETLMEVKKKIDWFLHSQWMSILQQDSITVVCMSHGSNPAIQRSLEFKLSGSVELYVHCQKINVDPYMQNIGLFIPFESDSINDFVDRAVTIINNVRSMQACSGYDDEKFQSGWSTCPLGFVDNNPYQEVRYEETFRSMSCLRLVHSRKWRCSECAKLYKPLKRRSSSAAVARPKANTANKYLTEQQRLNKLKDQAKKIENANRQISHLKARMQVLIQKNGVQIEEDLSDDFTEMLENGNMSPAQRIFLQQQVKASQKKNMVGMRWHPTMIRLALAIHLTSPAAYELMKETGMLKLPSSRTLFDYSHVKPIEEGIDQYVLDSVGLRVSKFQLRHKKYHVLMADEMHISQNLIFQKHSGKMIGYTSLDTLDSEVKVFEQYMDNPDKELASRVATKVLVYMVKGVSNGVKEVVATFAVGDPSVSQMCEWTWKVIRALESSGVWVIAFVCDGCSTNRAFIRMHEPATPNENGVVFDTVNIAAPHRNLYFIADVAHLLKTIRNCMLNSRWDKVKSRRRMVKNGKKISWDFIIKLYNAKKYKSLRKAFKLNAMNVFPDSYGRMKVKYAAEPLSRTVAQALTDEKWEDAAGTIEFIIKVNDWFDCLNGAHSSVGRKKKNTRLDPYTSENDSRFDLLKDFLEYLDDWKKEAEGVNVTSNNATVATECSDICNDIDESEIEDGADSGEPETPASKRMLSKQTLEGIEMTSRAFPLMVKFLLKEGTAFINARIFSQDPLEQHFSKVRAGQGSSTNPNVNQVLTRNRAIHTIGQLGMKKRKGNSGEIGEWVEVTSESLPKRQCNRLPKFDV